MTDNNTDDNNGHEVFLKPDPPVRNQEWVCLSIITPETVKNSKIHAIKIRGVYATENEARNRCKELTEIDPHFNIYIAQVGLWVPWVDDPQKADDVVYANEELNDLMKNYKKSQEKAKLDHEQRRQELVKQNINEANENEMKDKNNNVEVNDTELKNDVDDVETNNKDVKEDNNNDDKEDDNKFMEELNEAKNVFKEM